MSNSTVTLYYNNREISKKSLADVVNLDFDNNNIVEIDKDEVKKFTIEYHLKNNASNPVQGFQYRFDMNVNCKAVDDAVTIDKEVSGISLPQMGHFLDNKILIVLGIFFCFTGSILVFKTKLVTKGK